MSAAGRRDFPDEEILVSGLTGEYPAAANSRSPGETRGFFSNVEAPPRLSPGLGATAGDGASRSDQKFAASRAIRLSVGARTVPSSECTCGSMRVTKNSAVAFFEARKPSSGCCAAALIMRSQFQPR